MIVKNMYNMSEEEKRNYSAECEKNFEDQLDNAVKSLSADKKLKIITLAGPTCSGKTTTASKIVTDMSRLGKRVVVVSIDDFFRGTDQDLRHRFAHEKPNVDFDSVDAIDLLYFTECTEKIFDGKDAMLPIFDFNTTKRSGYRELQAGSYDIVMFEGIQAVYPEITGLLSHHGYKSIFTNVTDDICVNGIVFDNREVRFMRRIVRDYLFRGASPDLTMFLWSSVVKNENKNILPFAGKADVKINSLLPYEINLIKEPLLSILDKIPEKSEYYSFGRQLADKFENIPEISREYIPKDSVYREFLG